MSVPTTPQRRKARIAPRRASVRAAVRAAARETASSVYREAIQAAAQAEFTERGYAATKMADIARRAGVSVGALYRHFDSKEAIFVALMGEAADDVVTRMEQTSASVSDPAARIAALMVTALGFIEENRGMFLVFNQLRDADRAACHSLVDRSEQVRDRIFAVYRAALESGIGAGTLRRDVALDDQLSFLAGAIHGFIETWSMGGGSYRLIDKAPLIAQLVLRALGAPEVSRD